jgi:5'-nucleotidase (lipoprotein e(P4) family)
MQWKAVRRGIATSAGALVLVGMLIGCAGQCEQTERIDQLTDELMMANLWVQSSAEHDAVCYQAFNLARRNLDEALEGFDSELPPAVIVDCDDTVISSARYGAWMIANGESYTRESWKKWLKEDPAHGVPGAVDFLRYAESRGVEVFYITNRREEDREATLSHLSQLGCPFADDEHLLPKQDTGDREKDSDKTGRREQVAQTHHVLLLIGDVLPDFDQVFSGGKPAQRAELAKERADLFGARYIVIPNPVYGEWEDVLYDGNRGMPADQKVAKRREALDPWQPE